jgi:hypothetical protein
MSGVQVDQVNGLPRISINGQTNVEVTITKDGEEYILYSIKDGKVVYLHLGLLLITEDATLNFRENKSAQCVYFNGRRATAQEEAEKIAGWEEVAGNPAKYMTTIEELILDLKFMEFPEPVRTQNARIRIGSRDMIVKMMERRWKAFWKEQPDYVFFDGLSPRLMALAQELGSKRRTGGQHFQTPFTREWAEGAGGVQALSYSEIEGDQPPQEGWMEIPEQKTPKQQAGRVQDAQASAYTSTMAHEMSQAMQALVRNAIGAWNGLSNAQKEKNGANARKTAGGMKMGSEIQTGAIHAKIHNQQMMQAQTSSQSIPFQQLAAPLIEEMMVKEPAMQMKSFSRMANADGGMITAVAQETAQSSAVMEEMRAVGDIF